MSSRTRKAASEDCGNLLHGHSRVVQLTCPELLLLSPSCRTYDRVDAPMLCAWQKDKVLGGVVEAITVNVMDDLTCRQLPPQSPFDDVAMLCDASALDRDVLVAALQPALPDAAAVMPPPPRPPSRLGLCCLLATPAGAARWSIHLQLTHWRWLLYRGASATLAQRVGSPEDPPPGNGPRMEPGKCKWPALKNRAHLKTFHLGKL